MKEIKFRIMSAKGDEEYSYDVAMAREKFDELMALHQYTPMAIALSNGSPVPMLLDKFDENVEEIKWLPKIAGG